MVLPEIRKLYPEDFNIYRNFLLDCSEYSHSSNIFYGSKPSTNNSESFYTWLQTQDVYLCTTSNKNIGFFVLDINLATVSCNRLSLFVHPKVCKLAIINVARAASVFTYLKFKHEQETSFIMSTPHTTIYTVFQSIFNLNAIKHDTLYIMSLSLCDYKYDSYTTKTYEQEEIKKYMEQVA